MGVMHTGGKKRLRGLVAGALLVSGVATVADAQQPAVPRQRAAILLPPQLLGPGDRVPIARGAMDDSPNLGSTPVPRTTLPAGAPAWLTGADPNALPASGGMPAKSATGIRPVGWNNPLASRPSAGETQPFSKPFAKAKDAPGAGPALPGADPRSAVDPNAPLRGTAANGAPVLAGPPAYRWYGYGSVTPGANYFAPGGMYPAASANWYSVTGATPGAFPVPVVNPYRATPGNEPPMYAAWGSGRVPGAAPAAAIASEPSAAQFTTVQTPPPPTAAPQEPMLPASTPVPTLTPLPPAPLVAEVPPVASPMPEAKPSAPVPPTSPAPLPSSVGEETQWVPSAAKPPTQPPPPMPLGAWVPVPSAPIGK